MAYNYFADELGTEVVTLVVGRDGRRQEFVVHKKLLVSQSNFFKSALTTALFKEAVDGVMTFEEDDPDAFRLLVGWVYRGHIPRVRPFIAKPDFSTTKTKGSQGLSGPRQQVPPLTSRTSVDMAADLPDPDVEEPKDRVIARHLSAHKQFRDFSPEEIRLGDYQAAAIRLTDPLRRDGASSSQSPKPKKHSRIRQAWLDRDASGPTTVGRVAKVPNTNPRDESDTDIGSGETAVGQDGKNVESGSSSSVRCSDDGVLAKIVETADTTNKGTGDQRPGNSQALQRSEFTFRMEKPPQDDPGTGAILPRKGPLTCAAAAALAASRDTTATSFTPFSVATPEALTPPFSRPARAKKEKHEDTFFFAAPPPARSAEMWAERIKGETGDAATGSPTGGAEEKQEEKDNESEARRLEPESEAAGVAEVRWLNWSSSGDPASTSLEHATNEGDAHQITLVRLIVLAEKLCWDRLFNDAMDAYLDGERLMRRQLVRLAHLEVAYTQCCATSPLRRLLCDMVHFEAKTNLTHSRYLEFAETHEDFLADLFKRLDLRSLIPGKHPFEQLRNPLNVRKCNYHSHVEWSGQFCF